MPLFGACRVIPCVNEKTQERKFGLQAFVKLRWRMVTHMVDDKNVPMIFDTEEEANTAAEDVRLRIRRGAH